jgi:hypothetical protein
MSERQTAHAEVSSGDPGGMDGERPPRSKDLLRDESRRRENWIGMPARWHDASRCRGCAAPRDRWFPRGRVTAPGPRRPIQGQLERRALADFPASPNTRKLLHRWRDRRRLPDAREL